MLPPRKTLRLPPPHIARHNITPKLHSMCLDIVEPASQYYYHSTDFDLMLQIPSKYTVADKLIYHDYAVFTSILRRSSPTQIIADAIEDFGKA